jgi:hypothetical protein
MLLFFVGLFLNQINNFTLSFLGKVKEERTSKRRGKLEKKF